jgi:hypothetical protein
LAFGVLIAGVALGFVVGAAFPAQVTKTAPIVNNVTSYTQSTDSGNGSFNWLFTILVMGPAVVASSVLLGSAEIVAGLRRSGRSGRSSESGSTGDRETV